MFDLSWSEILVIGTAAIIFIGPKELPGALRTLGQWTAKAREMAREFRSSVDDMIRESEIQELKDQVDKMASGDLQRSIEKTIDPEGDINAALNAPDLALEDHGAAPAAPGLAASSASAPAAPAPAPAETAPQAPQKPAA